jgi:hypothetical protein
MSVLLKGYDTIGKDASLNTNIATFGAVTEVLGRASWKVFYGPAGLHNRKISCQFCQQRKRGDRMSLILFTCLNIVSPFSDNDCTKRDIQRIDKAMRVFANITPVHSSSSLLYLFSLLVSFLTPERQGAISPRPP